MKEVLEPLSHVAGVRLAALILADGVPVLAPGQARGMANLRGAGNGFAELEAAAGLCVGWMAELSRSVAPLSWDAPERAVLRAARGSLVLRRVGDVVLLVVVEAGLAPEELRLPIEAAAARLGRVLRDLSQPQTALPATSTSSAPAGVSKVMSNQRVSNGSPAARETGN
ncbi:MAG: hypothetical protein FJ299_10690 [Planctomycetes bacterium]|nr:hypothetical protein [Planctomycetota bacterium]